MIKPIVLRIFLLFLLYNLLFPKLQAQLCTGSLGDPVVHVSFGNSDQPIVPIPPGITVLTQVGSCPGLGQYSINNLDLFCSSDWYKLRDHTFTETGIDGNMLIVDASDSTKDIYVDTARGLCGNTVYQYAAWIANMMIPTSCKGTSIPPNLVLTIESVNGTVLAKDTTGLIYTTPLEAVWNQYGTFFRTPDTVTTLIYKITNIAKGGCGNTFALDDITIQPCGAKITASIMGNSADTLAYCINTQQPLQFNASFTGGYTNPIMQWQESLDTGKTWTDIQGQQNPNLNWNPGQTGIYEYRAAVAESTNFNSPLCRIESNVIKISVSALPTGPSFTNVLGCTNSPVSLNAIEAFVLDYAWTGPNGYNSTLSSVIFPSVSLQDSGLYQVLIHTTNSCSLTDSFYLSVFPGISINYSADTGVCAGNSVPLFATGGTSYLWSPSTGLSDTLSANTIATPTDSIMYEVLVSNNYGCKDSGYIKVNLWHLPEVETGPNVSVFEGDSIALTGNVSGSDISFAWTPIYAMANSNTLTPKVSPDDNTVYTLTASSGLGCGTTSSSTSVRVFKKVKVPNAFSPNGDGINDTWVITNLETYPESVLRVFNISGQLVFETRGNQKIWDGTYNGYPLPFGTYYYIIQLNGDNLPALSGSVFILR